MIKLKSLYQPVVLFQKAPQAAAAEKWLIGCDKQQRYHVMYIITLSDYAAIYRNNNFGG